MLEYAKHTRLPGDHHKYPKYLLDGLQYYGEGVCVCVSVCVWVCVCECVCVWSKLRSHKCKCPVQEGLAHGYGAFVLNNQKAFQNSTRLTGHWKNGFLERVESLVLNNGASVNVNTFSDNAGAITAEVTFSDSFALEQGGNSEQAKKTLKWDGVHLRCDVDGISLDATIRSAVYLPRAAGAVAPSQMSPSYVELFELFEGLSLWESDFQAMQKTEELFEFKSFYYIIKNPHNKNEL